MSTEELAIKHGALLYNEGEFDKHYVLSKKDLESLVCDVRINARISERDWLRLLIKKLLKEIE